MHRGRLQLPFECKFVPYHCLDACSVQYKVVSLILV
uniref:Uncharacterized protein n=1 Tax=Echinococcus granulosus TaxID=6210 RepID=A0A068WKS9_ECHGR|nr:hypothetical protein EgrG_001142500 [Echinococcus granulosus]